MQVAFGTGALHWPKEGDPQDRDSFKRSIVELIKQALWKGFINLDCSEMYHGSEELVGDAIKESGILRSSPFITNKHEAVSILGGWDQIEPAIDQSLEMMQIAYFDLYVPLADQTDGR